MNTTETLDLVLVDAQNAVQIFTGGGMAAILDGIEAKVRAIPLDPSTAPGREEIRSVAYRVARTKVALDSEGKKLTEGWREATKKVNAERARAIERLEALGEEVRKPLTEFENKEKVRVAAHEEALADITGLHALVAATPNAGIVDLEKWMADLHNSNLSREWEEFAMRAKTAREAAELYIYNRLEARKKYEVEQEELARLRKEEAERLQRERDEKLKAEAAEKARIEAERKAKQEADVERQRVIEMARRVQEETERARLAAEAKAKAEQDRLAAEARAIEEKRKAEERKAKEAADAARREHEEASRRAAELFQQEERAKMAAEQRAKDAEAARIASEKKAAAEKLAAEIAYAEAIKASAAKAKRDAEAAATREREKIERERKAAEDARLKRESDEAHMSKIRAEAQADLLEAAHWFGPENGVEPRLIECLLSAIMDGKVRHVRVVY